jgi:hypothetical protein
MVEFSAGVRALGSFQLDLDHRELRQGNAEVMGLAHALECLDHLILAGLDRDSKQWQAACGDGRWK